MINKFLDFGQPPAAASGAVAWGSITGMLSDQTDLQDALDAKGTGNGDALVANPLSQFAATTSLQLLGVISDETGSGALVFGTSPTLVTPTLGVATATSLTATGSLAGDNLKNKTYSIAVPTVVDDALEFATVTNTNFSVNVEIWFTVHDNAFAQSKRYFAPLSYNGTGGAWHQLLPVSTTGVYAGNNAEIDVKITNAVATFRIRRQAGTTVGTADINISLGTAISASTIADASGTYSGASSAANFAPTTLTQFDGKTGVNNDLPKLPFHIKGTIGVPAVSGTAQTGIARFDTTSGNANVLDLGAYLASPYGAWMQVTNRDSLAINYPLILQPNGSNVGIGLTSPTARLHLRAGSATASTGPLKFTSGVLNTTAEAGAVEFLTDAFYGTITTGATRRQFAFTSDITGTNSGTNTGDQTITLTGGVTGSGTGSFAATVITNANLTGHITSTGNATVLGSFTSLQLATALTNETGSGSAVFGTSPAFTTSITTASTSFTALAGATTLLTLGGTGASASVFMPSTLDATSSITGAIRTSGGISAAKAANIGTTLTVGGKTRLAGTDPVGATYTPATGGQSVALNVSLNNMHIVSGHASGTAITFTVTGATNNQPFIVSILQGGTTVSTIVAWFATVRWAGGVVPTLTATLNKRDTFGFIRTGVDTYDGFIVGQNA